jgi:hypothetical protein
MTATSHGGVLAAAADTPSAVTHAESAEAAARALERRSSFEYCVLRAVPRVERGDSVNVGVIVYCQSRGFLDSRTGVIPALLLALDPDADVPGIEAAVAAYACVCRGGAEAGQAGATTAGQRFRWLTAPRSTVVQPGPVHLGLTADPAAELARLAARLLPSR